MTVAPTYNRVYNFSGFQAVAPATPLPGNEVDAELSAIKVTLDALIANLALIQRGDGQLANASVGFVQLAPSLEIGFSPASAWSNAGVTYNPGQSVFFGTKLYVCIATNTSNPAGLTPDVDVADWSLLADFSANTLPPGSVTTAALANQCVTTAKIALGAVGALQLANGSVGPPQLQANAVTGAAIAAGAVTGAAIAAATIDFSKINTSGLPTVAPVTAGVWWLDGGVLSLSQP